MKIKSLTTESSGRLNKLNIPFWEKQIKGKKLTEKNEEIISYDVDVAKYSEFFFLEHSTNFEYFRKIC